MHWPLIDHHCLWGGLFSVALSVLLRAPRVTGHTTLWSSDFPPVRLLRNLTGDRSTCSASIIDITGDECHGMLHFGRKAANSPIGSALQGSSSRSCSCSAESPYDSAAVRRGPPRKTADLAIRSALQSFRRGPPRSICSAESICDSASVP